MKHPILYLASGSATRQKLLKDAHISFRLLRQDADESVCDWNLSLNEVVQNIARHKMNHVILPGLAEQGDRIIVITADTLVQSHAGICGKPGTQNAARLMLQDLRRGPVQVATGMCCELKEYCAGVWKPIDRREEVVTSTCRVDIADAWIDCYLGKVPYAVAIAGALSVEGYGAQFIREINGSYTGILGLPMCELRMILQDMGFVG